MRGNQFKTAMKSLFIAAAIVGPVTAFAQTAKVLDVTNSVWKYQPVTSDPGYVPADAWVANGFDDSGWPSGPGIYGSEPSPLPYPILTAIAGPAAGGPVASYFRTHFTFTGNPAGVALLFSNYVDDGILVWLNGVELFSYNMPPERPVPTAGTRAL